MILLGKLDTIRVSPCETKMQNYQVAQESGCEYKQEITNSRLDIVFEFFDLEHKTDDLISIYCQWKSVKLE